MDYIWIIFGIILVLVGLVGAIIPGIPGPVVSFFALLILQLKEEAPFQEEFLVIMGYVYCQAIFLFPQKFHPELYPFLMNKFARVYTAQLHFSPKLSLKELPPFANNPSRYFRVVSQFR